MKPQTALNAALVAPTPSDLGLTSDRRRTQMLERLAKQGITDPVVMAAMAKVPRHGFVDEGLASRAYDDTALPIGHGQTISQPYIVARMIELARNGRALTRVLEIGTGCGYQAAVLAHAAVEVFSIERIRALHEVARVRLRPLRLSQVRLVFGDGMQGLPEAAPFDAILAAAAGPDLPQALLDQLAIGGRLVAPIGSDNGQKLFVVTRVGTQQWERTELEAVRFVPLKSGVA